MTSLSRIMIEHQKATLKKQDKKDDSCLKSWHRLPNLQKNVILGGGIEEDGYVPTEATEEKLAILGCQNST